MQVVNFVQKEGDIDNQPESVLTTSHSVYDTSKPYDAQDNTTVNEVRQSIKAVLQNEKIREQAIINANDLQKKFNGNWFSLEQVIKKTKMKGVQQVHDLLNLLCLFQLAYREEKHGIIKYKITIGTAARKTLLQQELEEAKAKVSYLEDEITKLNFTEN